MWYNNKLLFLLTPKLTFFTIDPVLCYYQRQIKKTSETHSQQEDLQRKEGLSFINQWLFLNVFFHFIIRKSIFLFENVFLCILFIWIDFCHGMVSGSRLLRRTYRLCLKFLTWKVRILVLRHKPADKTAQKKHPKTVCIEKPPSSHFACEGRF